MILKPLETALNRYLALDPETPERLNALEGKTVSLRFNALPLSLQLRVVNQHIQLFPHEAHTPELRISGSPLSLLSLAFSADKKAAFLKQNIVMEGDTELGQEILDFFEHFEIDWEEHLSGLIGDLPAHELGRFTRGIMNWGSNARDRLFQNADEYIHEEKPWFPPEPLLQEFLSAVDELRLDVDRLEARIKTIME